MAGVRSEKSLHEVRKSSFENPGELLLKPARLGREHDKRQGGEKTAFDDTEHDHQCQQPSRSVRSEMKIDLHVKDKQSDTNHQHCDELFFHIQQKSYPIYNICQTSVGHIQPIRAPHRYN